MQTLHSRRTQMRRHPASLHGAVGGFTLIELMVVLAILSIMAAAAFAGIRQEEHRGQYKRFVADAHGALIQARNFAIDEQTQVQVTITDVEMLTLAFDRTTEVWELQNRVALDSPNEAMLEADGSVCIHGLLSGVPTPAQAEDQTPPTDCSSLTQTIQFESDGTFTDPDASFTTLDNAGATLWIGNHQVATKVGYAMIQIFPGGLIRKFDKVVVVGP